jgi:RNA polymerase sigma-70 factor (ECF subfamily)
VDQRGLVERARGGDHDAFTALVDGSLVRLDRAARLVLRDPELARDAVQETLIRVWRDLPGLRDPDRFEAWLHRLLMNACLDLARRRRRRPIEVDLLPNDAAAPSDMVSELADREILDSALSRLEPTHRAVVVMHFFLGMSLAEIAVALSIPVGTVKSRLHYSLAALRATVVRPPPVAENSMRGGQPA